MTNAQVVAVSGGADSTALALRLREIGENFSLLFTPTGNELGDVEKHVRLLADMCGAELHIPKGPSLLQLIDEFGALPNNRQRWCTRMIKIQPCATWLKSRPGTVLCVGLRADEPTREGGLYGELVTYRTPLREWGWARADVLSYLKTQGVNVPLRTDCALCYDQRLIDWYRLWLGHPDKWAEGESLENLTGHTFRSPSRDTQPYRMSGLRAKFEAGFVPTERKKKQDVCRVCRD